MANRRLLVVACCGAVGCYTGLSDGPADSAYMTGEEVGVDSAEDSGGQAPLPGRVPVPDADDTTSGGEPSPAGETGSIPEPPPEETYPLDEEGCHIIYAQDVLPTFELTIHPGIWEQLQYEWDTGHIYEDVEGYDVKPYHSLAEFRYEDTVITNASIRLRGNAEMWEPLPDDKMQFQIGFHVQDPEGSFMGLRRMALDAATGNKHFLRDRLALAVMRRVGLRAPCANHARLMINGEYYGLFTNMEKIDEIFLERTMEDPTGDLWKRAKWEIKTNEGIATSERLDAMIGADTTEALGEYLDIEQALLLWATEAVIPNSDGFWAGGLNGYYYDDPHRGKFMLLPWDLDGSFERFNGGSGGAFPDYPDPITWERATSHGRPFYDLALEDPEYFDLYIGFIDQITHEHYQPAEMLATIDEWSAQIEQAVLEDTHKPWDDDRYYEDREALREFVVNRYEFIEAWLECWQDGGENDTSGHCED
ncbi:CotH kinase family protein [Paraliomyxa miuraensis]|uniref:CotH kinase family protein n=1 Tax=Paraliomyxa miuraensis TaxID=376150 RepID=UPI00224F6FEC|nr:CotH kinase family protein [Paraliomyxa miuraensis]MCX4245314.1 CotH kinase family protein [Paraliomyxa miuraensis]